MNWRIPLSDIDFDGEETAAVRRVLASGWLSMGAEVAAFEREFAQVHGIAHAVAVSSGTAALHLAFLALGIGQGDEVIQPALTFVASANMTLTCRAKPVFADICSIDEPTIDPASVERLITGRTKAVVVMHYGGNLCRMAELCALCRYHNIALIEDACHAIGATYHHPQGMSPHGAMAGSIGDVGAFSFFSNKNLATGEGGMVICARDNLADAIKKFRSHGMTSLTWERHKGHANSYDVVVNGYNYRIDELHAAIGRVQLGKLARNNDRRRRLLHLYRRHLGNPWSMPFTNGIDNTSGHLMVAIAPDGNVRAATMERLRKTGIQTSMHYPCIADFHAFADWRDSALPRTREFVSRAVTLPLFPGMSPDQVQQVCAAIADDG